MSVFIHRLVVSRRIIGIAIPALTFLFALQLLRALIPGITWTLGDRWIQVGFKTIHIGLISLFVLMLILLIHLLYRMNNRQWSVIVTAGGVGLARLLVEIQFPEPLVNLGIAACGMMFFWMFLPIYLEEARFRGSLTFEYFALGLLIGLILDTTIHGAFGSYDTIWQSGLLAYLVTIALVILYWALLAVNKNLNNRQNRSFSVVIKTRTWQWIAIGPFLFIQLVIYQNIGRFASITGWIPPLSFLVILLTQIVALFATIFFLKMQKKKQLFIILLAGTAAIAASVYSYPQELWIALLVVVIGQVSISILMIIIIIAIDVKNPGKGFLSTTQANSFGMTLFLIFCFGYYAVYLINLHYKNTIIPVISVVIIVLCALGSSGASSKRVSSKNFSWLIPLFIVPVLAFPLIGMVNSQEAKVTIGNGFPVKLMTYNLHNGFNNKGDLDIETLARVIEDNNPDIVVLQEISRGWLISGRLDMLSWLSRRLNMNYIFGPTADPLWGSALMSRYPIVDSSNHELPPRDLHPLRGFISVKIAIGSGEYLNIIATHFHHVVKDSNIRILQAQSIINYWNGTERTILLGDLNADPSTPEMEMIKEAGLIDTMEGSELSSIFTFHSASLNRRIDYIWISNDLVAKEKSVPFSSASDHLPVIAVISRQ